MPEAVHERVIRVLARAFAALALSCSALRGGDADAERGVGLGDDSAELMTLRQLAVSMFVSLMFASTLLNGKVTDRAMRLDAEAEKAARTDAEYNALDAAYDAMMREMLDEDFRRSMRRIERGRQGPQRARP